MARTPAEDQPPTRPVRLAAVAALSGLAGVVVGAVVVGALVLGGSGLGGSGLGGSGLGGSVAPRPGGGAAGGQDTAESPTAETPTAETALGEAGTAGEAIAARPAIADGLAAVARAVLPSVVRVDVRGVGTGGNASGVVWDADGHVVTNHHVVEGAQEIGVVFADGTAATARLIGSDPTTDLAVLLVEGSDRPPITRPGAGEAEAVEVGQTAVVVGSPFGLDGTVTAGIISAVDRSLDLQVEGGPAVRLDGILQTDAGVDPGNSGGALVDARGQLLGITSAVLGRPTGGEVGFAIPAPVVTRVVDALIAEGRVPAPPYLGLVGVTTDAAASGTDPAGALVQRVVPGGPAAAAGLAPGDVVTAVDGVAVRTMADLVAAVQQAGVGGRIVLDVARDGTAQTATVVLTEAPGR